MTNNNLYGKVSPFSTRTYASHGCSVKNHSCQSVTSLDINDSDDKCSLVKVGKSHCKEVDRCQNNKSCNDNTSLINSDSAYKHSRKPRHNEGSSSSNDTSKESYLLHIVSLINEVRTQHGKNTDDSHIIQQQETYLWPYLLTSKEAKDVSPLGTLSWFLILYLDMRIKH